MMHTITDWQAASVPVPPSFGEPKWIPKGAPQNLEKAAEVDQGKALKIIVVDDESVIAETVVEILAEEGFAAMSVPDGAAAIELAKTWQPDVVLSDVIMPGLNGVEVGIKVREIVPGCKVILFSGQAATVDLLEKARAEGHRFEILAKPVRPEKLISAIRASSNRPS